MVWRKPAGINSNAGTSALSNVKRGKRTLLRFWLPASFTVTYRHNPADLTLISFNHKHTFLDLLHLLGPVCIF